MRNYAGKCKSIRSHNLFYNFLIQFLPLKSSVFAVHISNAFQHGNEAFPKVNFQDEIDPLHVIFHLRYSKYRGVRICFYSCRYQNQNFFTRVVQVAFVLHSCRSCSTRVALVLHPCCSCLTRVTLVLLVSHSCCTRVTHVALVLPVSGTRVVNQTRSKMSVEYKLSK